MTKVHELILAEQLIVPYIVGILKDRVDLILLECSGMSVGVMNVFWTTTSAVRPLQSRV